MKQLRTTLPKPQHHTFTINIYISEFWAATLLVETSLFFSYISNTQFWNFSVFFLNPISAQKTCASLNAFSFAQVNIGNKKIHTANIFISTSLKRTHQISLYLVLFPNQHNADFFVSNFITCFKFLNAFCQTLKYVRCVKFRHIKKQHELLAHAVLAISS